MSLFGGHAFDAPCRIEVEMSDERMCAHVELADGVRVGAGDRVRVHGDPIVVGFGERACFTRTATIERASATRRLWTRLAGHFELTELYEVSFSPRRLS